MLVSNIYLSISKFNTYKFFLRSKKLDVSKKTDHFWYGMKNCIRDILSTFLKHCNCILEIE